MVLGCFSNLILLLGCAMSLWRVTDVRVKVLAVFNVQASRPAAVQCKHPRQGLGFGNADCTACSERMLTSATGVHTSDGVVHCANDPLDGCWYQCCQEQHAGCDLSKASSPEHDFECTQTFKTGSQCCRARLQRFQKLGEIMGK